jgi:ferredoxin--NADP+ reductase
VLDLEEKPVSDSPRGRAVSRYNATVVSVFRVHDDLMILQVAPDEGPLAYQAGQYTTLGLGYWEPRLARTQVEELTDKQRHSLALRAYSISCSIVDEGGDLIRPGNDFIVEFYVSLVRHALADAPALTPRLFLLEEGDRLYMGPHAHGHYTLAGVKNDEDVFFAATGTGEAPHNAMIAELLSRGHRGRIAGVVCVRFRKDLAYLAAHRELEKRFSNYRYIPLTTREPENLDPVHQHYVGKLHIQGLVKSADFQERTQIALSPERTHVFLCGNPDMIGVPHHSHDPARRFPVAGGMVELLERHGFTIDSPHQPGNIHFEKYW